MTTTILIADDCAVFRHGRASLRGERDGWEVVAEAADGEEAVRLAVTLRPRIVVLSTYAVARYLERARQAEVGDRRPSRARRQVGRDLP